MTTKRRKEIENKHRIAVATYLALYYENKKKDKCMLTLTPNDEKYETVNDIRKTFKNKIDDILERKAYRDSTLAMFAVAEFGKDPNKSFNPHLHIQCFYDEIVFAAIQEAFAFAIKEHNLDTSRCHITTSLQDDVDYNYVIKTFLPENFDVALEEWKDETYSGKAMHWPTHKKIPSYLIKHLYKALAHLPSWDDIKAKYAKILSMLDKGQLIIEKVKDTVSKGFKQVKNWSYKLIDKPISGKTHIYKIKNTCAHEQKLLKSSNTNILIPFFFIWMLIYQPKQSKIKQSSFKPSYHRWNYNDSDFCYSDSLCIWELLKSEAMIKQSV